MPSCVVLVAGMHRSGSSAVARVLGFLGYGLPGTPIKDNASNRRGHWESQPLVRLNEAYLNQAGLVWSDWSEGALPRMRARDQRDFETDLAAVIADDFAPGRPAVVKDPRLSRVLPRYRAGLAEAGGAEGPQVQVIIPVRNPLEVVASLVQRNAMSRERAGLLWLRYMIEAVRGSDGMPRAFLSYDDLLADPIATLQATGRALGQAFPVAPTEMADDICQFLNVTLRSHVHTPEDVLHDDLMRGWVSDVYAALRRLCRDGQAAGALDDIARVAREFDAAAPVLHHLSAVHDAQQAEMRRRQAALDAGLELRSEQLDLVRGQSEDLRAELARLRAEADTLRADAASDLAEAQAQALAMAETARVEATTRAQAAARDALNKAMAAAAEADATLADTVARARADLAEAQEQAQAAETRAEQVLQDHRAAAKDDRRLARRAMEAAEARIADLERAAALQNDLVDRLRTEIRAQKEVYADQKASLAGLRAQLTETEKTGAKSERRAGRKAAEVNALTQELAEARARAAHYSDANAQILASTSWRLTWPLRATLNGLRRMGRGGPAPDALTDTAPAPSKPADPKAPTPKPPASKADAPKEPAQKPADSPAQKPKTDAKPAAKPAVLHPKTEEIARIENSAHFDADFYVDRYPDAAAFSEGPAAHYLDVGWRKGFDPSAGFVARAYEHSHADILKEDDCPLLHFLELYPDGTRPKRAPYADRADGGPKVAVYTAISGGYDRLNEPLGPVGDAEFFVFTDGKVPEGSLWQRRDLEYVDADPVRSARFVKTHPHLYFADYDFAIWVDANLALRSDPRDLLPAPEDKAPVYTWHHPLRDCIYDEGRICIELNKDDEGTIKSVLSRLEREGFPRNAGMMETSVFVSRMADPKTAEFHARWWTRIEQGSRRDQLALPPVLREMGLDIGHIAHKRICMRSDPRIGFNSHVKPKQKKAGTAA
ncbi:MAG: hypothetical protein CML68_10590 [Rhodobacteraceae bacterium]|nr:hypothetical protein [Paracoccaceae bacterium]